MIRLDRHMNTRRTSGTRLFLRRPFITKRPDDGVFDGYNPCKLIGINQLLYIYKYFIETSYYLLKKY